MLDEDGLKGMTSNPTIFEKAIDGSTDYDEQFKELAPTKKSIDEIYEALTMQDIKMAADALRPLYDTSGGTTATSATKFRRRSPTTPTAPSRRRAATGPRSQSPT